MYNVSHAYRLFARPWAVERIQFWKTLENWLMVSFARLKLMLLPCRWDFGCQYLPGSLRVEHGPTRTMDVYRGNSVSFLKCLAQSHLDWQAYLLNLLSIERHTSHHVRYSFIHVKLLKESICLCMIPLLGTFEPSRLNKSWKEMIDSLALSNCWDMLMALFSTPVGIKSTVPLSSVCWQSEGEASPSPCLMTCLHIRAKYIKEVLSCKFQGSFWCSTFIPLKSLILKGILF